MYDADGGMVHVFSSGLNCLGCWACCLWDFWYPYVKASGEGGARWSFSASR